MKKILFLLFLIANASFAQVDLSLGLRAYYPFTANANDISGNNNNPVFNNATLSPDRFGNPNSAYHFNGANNYMRIPNSASLNMANTLSISLWVKPTGFYTGQCYNNMMVMKGDGDNTPGRYSARFSDVYNGCSSSPSTTEERFFDGFGSIATLPIVQLNEWYSVVITHDGTTSKVYVNCVLRASFPFSTSFTNINDLFFGHLNSAQFPYWLNGDLDEIRIYDRALSVDEVNVLGGCTAPADCNNWLNLWVVNSSASVGDLDISGNQVTVEANFNATAPATPPNNYGFLVSKHTTTGDINYALWPGGCAISTASGDALVRENCAIEENKTYHAAMVYDGAMLKFYRNGDLINQTAVSGNLINNNLITTIGQNASGTSGPLYQFFGKINEVRIWNVARTQAEIQAFKNTPLPNPITQTGLKGYYVFSDLLNKQGNTAFNATLRGAATINTTNPNCTFLADPGSLANAGSDTGYCSAASIIHQLQGTGNGSFSWTPAIYLNNPNIQNPVATISATTTFYLTVTGASSSLCAAFDSVTIYVSPVPVIQTLTDTISCQFAPLILITNSNANSFLWSPAASVDNPTISNPSFIGSVSQRMYVTGKTGPGCSAIDSVDITLMPSPIVTTIEDTTLCLNQTVILNTNGGLSYTWSPATGLNNPFIANPVFSGNTNQTYTVTGSSINGCTGSDIVNISISSPASLKQPPYLSTCLKQPAQLNGNNGTRLSYLWSPSTHLSNSTIINPWATPPLTTAYTVVVTDNICGFDSTFTTVLTIFPPAAINAGKSNDMDCAFHSASLSASGGIQYLWSPSTGLSSVNIPNPLANPTVTQTYYVKVTDAFGCKSIDSVTIYNKRAVSLARYMPNAFTPNGDNLNDCYGLKSWLYVKKLQFFIFNRFGETVFATANPTSCWDGTHKGKPALAGTYVYVIKAETECGVEEQKGSFVLLR